MSERGWLHLIAAVRREAPAHDSCSLLQSICGRPVDGHNEGIAKSVPERMRGASSLRQAYMSVFATQKQLLGRSHSQFECQVARDAACISRCRASLVNAGCSAIHSGCAKLERERAWGDV